MACSEEFIEHLCDVLSPLGEVRSRKMMGDYLIYVNGKCVITACNNTAYVKKLPCIQPLMSQAKSGTPYPRAKEAYILDISDPSHTCQIITALWDALPFPKKAAR